MPKFNLNWLYMIIAMMLLGLYLTNESGTATKNISYDEFQQYVRDGTVSYILLEFIIRDVFSCRTTFIGQVQPQQHHRYNHIQPVQVELGHIHFIGFLVGIIVHTF